MSNKKMNFIKLLSLIIVISIFLSACDTGTGIEGGSLEIIDIEKLSDKSVEYGTDFEDIDIPEEVEVSLSDNSTTYLDVDWAKGSYNGKTPETYTIIGELNKEDNIVNPDGLYPSVKITVYEKDQTLYLVSIEYDENKGQVIGNNKYSEGEEVELTAIPNEGYQFVEWTGYINSLDAKLTFDMPSKDIELNADFIEKDKAEKKYALTIKHKGEGSTSPGPGENIKDKGSSVSIKAEPESGWKFLGWSGDIQSKNNNDEIIMDDHKEITAHFIEEDETGLVFEHNLIMQEDTSNPLKVEVIIKNIDVELLNLQVVGTIFGNLADKADSDEKIFEFIDYDSFKVSCLEGEELNFSKTGKEVHTESHLWDQFFNIDEIEIETDSNNSIKIEYEVVSNYELWEGFGGNVDDFEGQNNPAHFWSVFKEWFILRPSEQKDRIIARNHLYIDLPDKWNYSATYPDGNYGSIDLGELKYMRWNNDKEWKNFQRAPLVLYHEDTYNLNKETIAGTKVKDVYHKSLEGIRNQEANHQFFRFFSEFFGELPMEKVLFFADFGIGGDSLEHGDAYASGPYSYGYSSKGRFFGSGADLGVDGRTLDEPQKWSIVDEPDEEYNHLFPIHGTARMWIGALIRAHNISGVATYAASQAVASYYTDWDVNKNRYQRKYDFYLEEVVQDGGEEKDISGVTGHGFHGYFKVSLTYFYIDELITEKSNGTRSLKDVMNYFYNQVKSGYDTTQVNKTKDLLIESIDYAAGDLIEEDYIEFIVKHYIFGDEYRHEFLDLSDYLEVNNQ